MRQRFRREGSCFRRLRSGVRRVKPSSWNGRGRERTREGARENAERGRGRQRERARPFGPGPVQAQPRALGAAWARLRTRTAKALWLPVRLGARARLSASVSRAGTGREDASTAVPNCGHQGAPEEEEEGGGGGERGREGKGERRRGVTGGRGCAPLVLRRHGLRAVVEEALAAAGRLRRGAAAAQHRG
ncbi:unnamed protein product, partial [Prorocentrum cordatum]